MTAAELFTTIPAKPTPPAGVLRGPANADNFRQKVGRYSDRHYIDTLPTCDIAEADPDWIGPSITVVKKAAGFGAAEFVVMDRMSQSDELETIARQPKEKRYGRLKNLNDEGRNEAFARGHGIHLAAEQILYGEPVTLREGEPGWDYLTALQSFFDTCQPTLVAAEVVCLHRDLNGKGYGGTTDAIVGIDGGIWGIDYKSRGKEHGAYPEEAAQIAAYIRAQYMLVEGEHGAERRLLPTTTGGLIVSITKDSFEIHPIDVDKAFEHWTSLHAWWLAKQDERKTIGRKWAPRKLAAPVSQEPAPTGEGLSLSTSPVDDRRLELRRRFNLLNDHDRAKFRGLMLDPDDLDLIETHLNAIDLFMTNDTVTPPPKPPIEPPTIPAQRPKVVPIPEPSLGAEIEGPPAPEDLWSLTAQSFDRLDTGGKEWIKAFVADAHAAQAWMSGASNKTTRRLMLLRGLVCLSGSAHVDGALVRVIVNTVLDAETTGTVGQAVGSLNHVQATEFNRICEDFTLGVLEASVTPDGSMRLVAA